MQTKVLRRSTSLVAGAIVGNVVAERYVLRAPGSDTGFVPVTDGIGLDELARGLTILVAAYGIDLLLGKVWK